MLTERLACRPFGIEPVEHLFQPAGRNARAAVLNRQFRHAVLIDTEMKADGGTGRREGDGIAKKIVQNLDNAAVLDCNPYRCLGQIGRQVVAFDGCLAGLDEIADKVAKVDGGGGLCRHLVIHPA